MKLFSKRKQKCVMAEQEAMASDIADILLSHIWSINYPDKQWIEELSIFSKQPISSWRWFHTVRMKMLLIAAPCVLFGMQIATGDGSYLSKGLLLFTETSSNLLHWPLLLSPKTLLYMYVLHVEFMKDSFFVLFCFYLFYFLFFLPQKWHFCIQVSLEKNGVEFVFFLLKKIQFTCVIGVYVLVLG